MLNMNMKTRGKKRVVWEYRLYFTLIFILTLPHTMILCFLERLGVLERKSYNKINVISRAWTNAQIFTPTIFSA